MLLSHKASLRTAAITAMLPVSVCAANLCCEFFLCLRGTRPKSGQEDVRGWCSVHVVCVEEGLLDDGGVAGWGWRRG